MALLPLNVGRSKKNNSKSSLLNSEARLRSKRELIETLIEENLPVLDNTDEIPEAFEKFWNEEQKKAFDSLIKKENLSMERTQTLREDYLYAEKSP